MKRFEAILQENKKMKNEIESFKLTIQKLKSNIKVLEGDKTSLNSKLKEQRADLYIARDLLDDSNRKIVTEQSRIQDKEIYDLQRKIDQKNIELKQLQTEANIKLASIKEEAVNNTIKLSTANAQLISYNAQLIEKHNKLESELRDIQEKLENLKKD